MTLRHIIAFALAIVAVPAFAGTAHPGPTDSVTVSYVGRLDNGTVFDSSARHGGPATFRLNHVIPCWTNGVQKMTAGETKELTCPPETAYGARGIPGVIPPNSTLHFKVTLIRFSK